MGDITLSKAVRSNLLSLQNTASMMASTQERLATGNKVNSALDNPTNFFTASSLNSRAGDINQLLDGMANGIQTIKAADNGLSAITKTLESMQSTLRQARQDKSFQTQSLTTLAADATVTGDEAMVFSGGSISGSDLTLNLTEMAGATPARNAVATGTAALGSINTSATGAGTKAAHTTGAFTAAIDVSTTALAFDVSTDGGAAQSVSIDGAAVTAYNSTNGTTLTATALSAADVALLANAQLTSATVTVDNSGSDPALVFTSTAANSGTASTLSIANTAGASTSGIANTTAAATGDAPTATALTFDINGEEVELAAGATYTAEQIRDAINTQVGTTANVTASLNAQGRLVITSNDTAAAADSVTIDNFSAGGAAQLGFAAGASATASGADANDGTARAKSVDTLVSEINSSTSEFKGIIRASNDNGKLRIQNLSTTDLAMTGVGSNGVIDGTSTAENVIDGNAVRSDLATQFRDLRDQLDKLADDASFNGINLLRGDNLQITFNENGTSELNIRSKDEQGISSTVLKLATDLKASDLDSDASIDKLIGDVKTAINTVRSQSSAFGSSLSVVQNRQDFSKNMINTLQTGASNLTLADMNEEAANLLALQTRQSLSSSALSMASQADQSVLQLLR